MTARRGAHAWPVLAALLALGALAAWALPPAALEWQPRRVLAEPWRALTAAWVHYSPRHLGANLLGAALLGALGWRAALPARAALAWALAWPLTQLGLLLRPELARYGGLSGVLHAGAAVAAVHLLRTGPGRARGVGAALLAGLALKVAAEAPFGPVLQIRPGWDIAIAPFAHLTGLAAGLLAALFVALIPNRPHD